MKKRNTLKNVYNYSLLMSFNSQHQESTIQSQQSQKLDTTKENRDFRRQKQKIPNPNPQESISNN